MDIEGKFFEGDRTGAGCFHEGDRIFCQGKGKTDDRHQRTGAGLEIITYEEIVDKVKEIFSEADVSMIDEHLAYQFNITGEGEGAFYAEVKDGKLDIQPFEYFDRDSLFICSADVLFKIISGKLDPVLAFTLGKLKVEGSIEKALRLKEFVK